MTASTRSFTFVAPITSDCTPRATIIRNPAVPQTLFGGWGPRLH